MKCRFILGAALLCGLCAWAEQKQALVLHTSEGGSITYFLEDEPTVTFAGQEMLVATADNETAKIPMDDVEEWTIEMKDWSGIADFFKSEGLPSVSIMAGAIYVSNPQGGAVSVYAMDGRLAATQTGTELQFDLPAGIYIIKTNQKTFKITNR